MNICIDALQTTIRSAPSSLRAVATEARRISIAVRGATSLERYKKAARSIQKAARRSRQKWNEYGNYERSGFFVCYAPKLRNKTWKTGETRIDHLTPKIKNNLYLENLAWHFQILQPFSFYYWCPTRKFLACTVIITKNKQDEPGGAPAAPTAARRQPRTSASQNATTNAIRDTSYRLWLRWYIMGSPCYNDATPANAAKVCLQSLVVCLLQLVSQWSSSGSGSSLPLHEWYNAWTPTSISKASRLCSIMSFIFGINPCAVSNAVLGDFITCHNIALL